MSRTAISVALLASLGLLVAALFVRGGSRPREEGCEHLLHLDRAVTRDDWEACLSPEAFAEQFGSDDEVERQHSDLLAIETAPWFGSTGLPERVERQVAEYVRLEFGESIGEAGALKASELEYVGRFDEDDGHVHYWAVPGDQAGLFVHVVVRSDGRTTTGMSERRPPGP